MSLVGNCRSLKWVSVVNENKKKYDTNKQENWRKKSILRNYEGLTVRWLIFEKKNKEKKKRNICYDVVTAEENLEYLSSQMKTKLEAMEDTENCMGETCKQQISI